MASMFQEVLIRLLAKIIRFARDIVAVNTVLLPCFLMVISKLPVLFAGKNAKEDLDCDEYSSFVTFVERTKNMPEIWEQIMSTMSATDVARCLRVCKSLRRVIQQCYNTNSKFRQKMDVAVTVSALRRSSTKSTFEFTLEGDITNWYIGDDFECISGDQILALDDTWYRHCTATGRIDIHRLMVNSGDMLKTSFEFNDPSITDDYWYPCFRVHPTMNPDLIYIEPENEGLSLFNLAGHEERSSDGLASIGTANVKGFTTAAGPNCIQYRIFAQEKGESGFQVIMAFAGDDGRFNTRNTTVLHNFNFKGCPKHNKLAILHQTSKEEAKMLLVLSDKLAVHDTRTGGLLWQQSHRDSYRDIYYPFITAKVTGYLVNVPERPHYFEVKIYDTLSGKVITTQGMEVCTWGNVLAKGPYICSRDSDGIDIICVESGKNFVRGRRISFPAAYIASIANWEDFWPQFGLFGFLGKSNILLGQFWDWNSRDNNLIFSLDLDLLVLAKDEKEEVLAFGLPLGPKPDRPLPFVNCCKNAPVYRTDRTVGSVNLVGVMKATEEEEEENTSVRTYIFTTSLQCAFCC